MIGLSQRLVERDNRIIKLEKDIELLEDMETFSHNKVVILEKCLDDNGITLPAYYEITHE